MINKIKYFFNNLDAAKVNKLLGPILLIYLFLGMLAYKLIPIPFIYNLVRTSSIGGVIVRILSSGMICIFSLFVCLANKKRFPISWLIIFVLILLCILTSTLLTNHSYAYGYIESFFSTLHYKVSVVGLKELILMFLSTVSDFAVGFCFVFLLPFAFTEKKTIRIYIYCLCAFMLYQVIFSLISDADAYRELLSGVLDPYRGTALSIKGGFSDKEDFGAFLTMACASSLVAFWLVGSDIKRHRLVKIVLFIISLIFFVFSILSLCKTAAISCLACYICFVIAYLFDSYKKSKKRFFIVLSIILLFISFFFCFYYIPALHSFGFFQKIYNFLKNYIIDRIQYVMQDRDNIWMFFMSKFNGINILFGIGKGGIDAYYYSINPTSQVSIHNGLVYFMGSNGIVAFILFLIIFFSLIYVVIKLLNKNKTLMISIVGSLLCALIFSLSERDMIILSSSTKAFSYNIILTLLPIGLYINDDNHIGVAI